ncbi:hypothetical protein [Actinoplanes sp. NPDC051411]|uniref:hypothetical protein n=1 Tax=Actinoplanes sp. NPDC051411 TaxID=3155522 RepID=UPI00343986F8
MIEHLAKTITDWFTGLTSSQIQRYLILLGAAWLSYLIMRLVLRVIFPALVRGAVTVVHGVLVGLALAGLFTQGLAAMPFRAVGVRPPSLLYRSGDALAASVPRLRRGSTRLKSTTYALARTPPLIVLAFTALIVWQGHAFACGYDGSSEVCRQPADAVVHNAVQVWHSGVNLVTGNSP